MKPIKKPAYIMKEACRVHTLWGQLLLYAGMFLFTVFAEGCVLLLIYTIFPASEGTSAAPELYATLGSVGLILLLARRIDLRGFASLSLRQAKKTWFLSEYLFGLIGGAFLFALALLFNVATGAAAVTLNAAPAGALPLGLFFLGFLIQGFSEELFSRGYLLGGLMRIISLPMAVLLSSIAFSAIHYHNPGISFLAFVNLMLFGVLTALLTLRRGSLWAAAGLHAAWNFIQGNIFGIPVSGTAIGPSLLSVTVNAEKTLLNGGSFGFEGGLGVTLVFTLGIAVTLLFMEQKN